ncbi:adenine phosphoribosyltransferase isoform X1 [Stegostoma tigrinum]|uniref:adenine phosphoribosyltransferase isoform X1 n=1 Tax=Stegostoma tigrinum TaxID=3053191 RepID=UPI00202B25C7|nr:adenine phosphoribosyltransferase isoform X1 [Stegostoma tigrinum]
MCSESESLEQKLRLVHSTIRSYPDFPTEGIVFRDIFPVLHDPKAFSAVIDLFEDHLKKTFPVIDLFVGLDARGFLFAPILAQRFGIGFVPVRKKGKLPGPTLSVSYSLEYGEAEVELQRDVIQANQKVVIVDDLLATGGTLSAACDLLNKTGANILGCLVVIELKALNGAKKLNCVPLHSLVQF